MKIKYFLVLLPILIFASFSYVFDVFAEGETFCDGEIIGETLSAPNVGVVNHDASQGTGESISLSVWQRMPGYFPNRKIFAACAMNEIGIWHDVPYEYSIRGWAGATNLGYFLYHCSSLGRTNTGWHLDFPCIPKTNFGLYIGQQDDDGDRSMLGFAYSPVVGFLKPFVTLSYDELTKYWITSGHFLSQAGTISPFDEIKFDLGEVDEELEAEVDDGAYYCAGKKGVCIEVRPYPKNHTAIANGVDAYYIYMWIRGDDAQELSAEARNDIAQFININWKNTVKLNHYDPASESAVLDLPRLINDFVDCSKKTDNTRCVEEIAPDYVSQAITSYAPTDGALTSLVYSANPQYEVQNGLIHENISGETFEKNILQLEFLEYGSNNIDNKAFLTKALLGFNNIELINTEAVNIRKAVPNSPLSIGQVHANGIPYLNFDFKPPISFDGYVYLEEDKFSAVYNVPEDIRMIYAQEEGNYQDVNVSWQLGSSENCNFTLTGGGVTAGEYNINSQDYNIQVVATQVVANEVEGVEIEDECKPSFLSKISLQQAGKSVSYPGFGIPKVFQEEDNNPQIMIYGNIRGSRVFDKDLLENRSGYTVVNVDRQRNIAIKNIARFLEKNTLSEKVCMVTALNGDGPIISGNCVEGTDYVYNIIAGQHVVYSYGATFRFQKIEYNGHYTFVIENANIYIGGNLTKVANTKSSLALMAFRDNDNLGLANVYIGTCSDSVGRIEASIFADGYMTSNNYREDIDQGLPKDIKDIRADSQCPIYLKGSYAASFTVGGVNPEGEDFMVSGTGELVDSSEVDNETLLKFQAQDLNYLRSSVAALEIVDSWSELGTMERCPMDWSCGVAFCGKQAAANAKGELFCGEFRDSGTECTTKIACNGIDHTRAYIDLSDEEIEGRGLNLRYFSRKGDLKIRSEDISQSNLPENIAPEAAFHAVYIEYEEPESIILNTN